MECAGRNGRREIIVPVVVIYKLKSVPVGSLNAIGVDRLLQVCSRFKIKSNGKINAIVCDIPASSGFLKASAPGRGLARVKGALPGVPPNRVEGPASEPIDARRDDSEDLRALFHCLTSSTAWLKLEGAFETGASARRHPVIQGWRSSFRAVTRRLGSFWKHCIRKSRAACIELESGDCQGGIED